MRAFLAALCVLMLFNFSSAAEEKTMAGRLFPERRWKGYEQTATCYGPRGFLCSKGYEKGAGRKEQTGR